MAQSWPLTQADRRIKIRTVLDQHKQPGEDDPLLPAIMQCSEAISAPYYIDLLMYANRDLEIEPQQLINTAATVSVRIENFVREHLKGDPVTYTYQTRKGVIQNFQRQDRLHRRVGRDLNVYMARLVPAFLIMDQEVRYRIFEQPDLTFGDVLTACMSSFKGLNLANYVDPRSLQALTELKSPPPKMEHCVQYGESTFNFLSRLMAGFSIWYYFDHDGSGQHETLVLGSGPVPGGSMGFNACSVFDNYPDPRDPEKQLDLNKWQIVTGLGRVYTPPPRLTRTSGFNTMVPTNPPQSNDETADTHLDDKYDIINAADGTDKNVRQCTQDGLPQTTFIQEQFPDSTIYEDDNATDDAQTAMQVAEGQVFTASGATRNASFCAARVFRYLKGDDNQEVTDFLISRMSLNAYERYWLQFIHHDTSLRALVDDILVAPIASFLNQALSSNAPDLTNAMANAGLQEYTQNWLEQPPKDKPAFSTYFGAGAIAYLTSFLPNTTTVLQDLLGIFSAFLLLMVDAVISIVEVFTDIVLGLPSLVLNLFGVKNVRQKVHAWFEEKQHDIKKWIENLLVRDDDACSVSFVAVPLDHGPFGVPLPTARKAQVFGPHLATVIGPQGVDTKSGEIWADALGRVRVRFPWDRTPWERTGTAPSAHGSEKLQYSVGMNSVWVRVSEAWAGQKFGTQFLPRIGQEVIVSFIDGDPDRPVITGRVYNADSATTNLTFPPNPKHPPSFNGLEDVLSLAKTAGGDLTLGGIETRSTPMPRDAQGNPTGTVRYHLLRFDDRYGDEQLLLRSQGRLDVTSKGSSYQTTEGDRHVLAIAGKDKAGNYVGGSIHTTTGSPYFGKAPAGEYTLHVGGNRREQVDLKYQLKVLKDTELDLKGNCTEVVGGTLSLSAASIVLNADTKITLRAAGHSIVMNGEGVFADTFVELNSGSASRTADKAGGVTTWTIADAEKADPGEPANSRAGSSGGSGGPAGGNAASTQDQSAASSTSPAAPPPPAPAYMHDSDNSISCPLDSLCGADGGGA